jgi:hypothetical protein
MKLCLSRATVLMVSILSTVSVGCVSVRDDGDEEVATQSHALVGVADAMHYAHAAGIPCDWRLVVAGAIAMAESSGSPTAVGRNGPTRGCPNGSRDRGLWQINDCYHPSVSDACAFDSACNAQAMVSISNHGSNFQPWATFTGGAYRAHLGAAQGAFDAVCGGGDSPEPNPTSERPAGGPFEALDVRFVIDEGAWITQCNESADAERAWQTLATGGESSTRWAEARYAQQILQGCGAPNGDGVYPLVIRGAGAPEGGFVTQCSGSGNVELVFRVDGEVDGRPAASFRYGQISEACP